MSDFTSELDEAITSLQESAESLRTDVDALLGIPSQAEAVEQLAVDVVALTQALTSLQAQASELSRLFGTLSESVVTAGKSIETVLKQQAAQDVRLRVLEAATVVPRSALVAGAYVPGKDTTGAYGTLTKQVGNLTTQYDGQVFEDLYIEGQVTIKHAVEFRRCHIKGGVPTAKGYAVVRCYDALSRPAKLIDCTIEATPHVWSSCGVQGRDIHVIRCNIFGSVDGVMATNSGFKLHQSWIHDLFWSPTGHHDGGPTHNDLIQIEGGNGQEVVGNSMVCGTKYNAAIMVTQNVARITGLLIEHNYFSSTEPVNANQTPIAINIAQGGKGGMTGVRIAGNRFSVANTWRLLRVALIDAQTYDDMVAKGNLVDNLYDDGTPAKLSRNNVAA